MLTGLTRVRSDERRDALAGFLTLFGIMAGHALLETARDALFLSRIPPEKLPWVYLAIAGAALIVTQLRELRGDGAPSRLVLARWLWVAAAITLGFWVFLPVAGDWSLYALYVWSGVLATLVLVHFWTLMGDLFTVTQAKRLFTVIGTGSVLGAIAGTGVAGLVTALSPGPGARHLLLAATGVLLATGLAAQLVLRQPESAERESTGLPVRRRHGTLVDSLRTVLARPYATRLAGLVLISTVGLTVADYIFKREVALNVATAQLGTFFATVYFALNLLSLLVQVFLVGWLVRRLSITGALAVLPALLLLGSLGLIAGGALVAALAIKSADGGLRHSLHRTAVELLFVPMTERMRRRVKAFIDVVGQRGGQALASVMILLLAFVDGHLVLGGLLAILVAAWIAAAGGLKRHYLDLFRGTLNEELVQTRIDFPALDMGSLESMIAALNSTNDAEVMAALELLAAEKKVRVIPTLILYHPSDEVKIKALEIFAKAGRDEFLDLSDRLVEGASPPVQAAILRARSALQPDEQLLRQHLDVDCPVVSGTALVSLIAADWMDPEETAKALTTRIEDGSKETRVALAQAIAYQPSPTFADPLLRLADSSDRELRLEVAKAMKAVRSPRFLPALLSMLTERDLRPAAREAIVALGERVLDDLDEALRDPDQPLRVRRHLPRTISRFGSQRAACILLDRLPSEPDGMTRYKILRGLAQLRRLDPEIELDASVLDLAVEQTVRHAYQLLDWRDQLSSGSEGHPERSTPVQDLLLQLLRDKKRHAVERLFTLLGLRFVDEDFGQIYRGLLSASREARSSSRELLENRLAPPLREAVIGLIERDASLPERLEQAGQFHRRRDLDYADVLRDLIESPSESIRSLAVYHVGELGLSGLKPDIEALEPAPQSYLSGVVERVVSLLPAARRGKLAFEN